MSVLGARDTLLMKNFFTSFSTHFHLCTVVHLLFCCVSQMLWTEANALQIRPGGLFEMQMCPQSAV